MKCETCQGRGFTELEHGLIMVECEVCKGTGELKTFPAVSASGGIPDGMEVPEGILTTSTPDGEPLIYTLPEEGKIDGIDSRTGQPDKPSRSTNTGQPKQQKKPRAKKKARKGTG